MPNLWGLVTKAVKAAFIEAPQACFEAGCGLCLGFVKGVCGLSLYTAPEVEELEALNRLAEVVVKKSPELSIDPAVCEGIKNGSIKALNKFKSNLSNEALDAGVGLASSLVCKKAFLPRFSEILMDACVAITQCK